MAKILGTFHFNQDTANKTADKDRSLTSPFWFKESLICTRSHCQVVATAQLSEFSPLVQFLQNGSTLSQKQNRTNESSHETQHRADLSSQARNSSTLLCLYLAEKGPEAVFQPDSLAQGQFSFAYWDINKQHLYLGCSHHSTDPIFLRETANGLYFGSLAGDVLRGQTGHYQADRPEETAPHSDPLHFDEALFVDRTMGVLSSPDNHPLFKDIQLLQAGSLQRWDRLGKRQTCIAPAPPQLGPPAPAIGRDRDRVAQILQQGEAILRTVVKQHLGQQSGPACVHLSGGLDSGLVTAATSDAVGDQGVVHAFTVSENSKDGSYEMHSRPFNPNKATVHVTDEFPHTLPLVESRSNIIHHRIERSMEPPLDLWRSWIDALALPPFVPMAFWWHIQVGRVAAVEGADRILTGEGGNLTVSPKGLNLLCDLAKSGQIKALTRAIRDAEQSLGQSQWSLWRRWVIKPALPYDLMSYMDRTGRAARAYNQNRLLDAPFRGDVIATHGVVSRFKPPMIREDLTFGWKQGMLRLAYARLGAMRAYFRAMGLAVPTHPLIDPAVVTFFSQLPPDLYMRDGETRWIARKLYTRIVGHPPPERIPLGDQVGDWHQMHQDQAAEIANTLDALTADSFVCRLIDVDKLRTAFESIPADPKDLQPNHTNLKQRLDRGIGIGLFLQFVRAHTRTPD